MSDAPKVLIQPAIAGYRQLSEADAALINRIKAQGESMRQLVDELKVTPGLDQRCVSIAATELQTGLMWLTRAVAQPQSF